ncbi:Myristoyl-CoA:protein N-myristoyltransferase, N-terminal domain-containing protein [Mycena maculata]|uniref:Glycylpeptide N-tetradecanoyltransferase n=1 Tax=Mycena maculata TaxID=230809 RepID=A0AAD7II48_9AGAR|nr:Myristoyl-CoA:protein N-myristoyltransferase, N-terminal domain-containing protein [Mycena maculata]
MESKASPNGPDTTRESPSDSESGVGRPLGAEREDPKEQRKKKKKKGKATKTPAVSGGSDLSNDGNIHEVLEKLKTIGLDEGKAGVGADSEKNAEAHKFWGTQPVPQLGEGPPVADGYIEPWKPREEVRQEPYPLPQEFEWATVDIKDPTQNTEVHDLLSRYYVEDQSASLRFQYSSEFLQWALTPPGYFKEWHIGVRVSSNKKLVAFISGVPMKLRVRGKEFVAGEVNYICIHKKLRSKRLAPVLIKEVTRQVHLQGIFQAIYTAEAVIPTPISVCQYYHRSLNVPKLLDIGFTQVPRNSTTARMIRTNMVADTPTLNIRPMEEKDVASVGDLFARYMRRFDMVPVMALDDVRHQFLSGQGTGNIGDEGPERKAGQVIWTYVVEDPATHVLTDFFSFYSLPSTILRSTKYQTVEAGYLYYYATEVAFDPGADEDGRLKARLMTLIGDALVIANRAKMDVFNAQTLMDNVPILKDLKFGPGSGFLNFYLYNWRTAKLAGMADEAGVKAGKGVGVVML